jgi:hemoglobin-like flavoprotein
MKPEECDLCWPFECSGRHETTAQLEAAAAALDAQHNELQERSKSIDIVRGLIAALKFQVASTTDPEMREAWRKALANANLAGSLLLAQRPGRPPVKPE